MEKALRNRDIKRVKALLKQGIDVNNTIDQYWNHPLHLAASIGDPQMVSLLLSRGANVNVINSRGDTPLHNGAGKLQIVKLLLDRGSNVNAKNNYGNTPLMSALHFSSEDFHKPIVKLLIKRGARVNVRNNHNSTPLHKACSNYEPGWKVRILLDNGAAKDAKDSHGNSPLLLLFTFNPLFNSSRFLAVKYLLDAGANPNVKEGRLQRNRFWMNGPTPLHIAADRGVHKFVKLLLDAGANPNSRYLQRGRLTPLHLAVDIHTHLNFLNKTNKPRSNIDTMIENSLIIVKMLLKAGANPNARDGEGMSPLHSAVKFSPITSSHSSNLIRKKSFQATMQIIQILLQAGANPYLKTKSQGCLYHNDCNKTPIQMSKNRNIAKFLQEWMDAYADARKRMIKTLYKGNFQFPKEITNRILSHTINAPKNLRETVNKYNGVGKKRKDRS